MKQTAFPLRVNLYIVLDTNSQLSLSLDSKIQQIIALLIQKLDYPWQISELAEIVGLERRQLERRFRAATNHSPLEYLRMLRLKKAADLLDTTSDPIQHIAKQVGFADKHHFRSSFQKYYFITPGEYRKHKARNMSQMTLLSKNRL